MSDHKDQSDQRMLVSETDLSPIPDKLYFSISEVGGLCDLKPHVLRYWEQEFSQLSPAKRRGNRRYYQRKDVLLIRQIKHLLYTLGYTIDGARQCLAGTESQQVQKMQHAHACLQSAITRLEKVVMELEVA